MSAPRAFLAALAAFASSCVSAPKPPPPVARIATDHFAGTVHTGPLPRSAPADPGEPRWFEIRLDYSANSPSPDGEPISAHARQVFVETGDDSVRARSELALGIVRVDPSRTPLRLAALAPAWPATTATWRAEIDAKSEDPPHTSWSAIELQITPADDSAPPQVALVVEGKDAFREHLVLDAPPVLSIFLPAPREQHPHGGFRVELRRIERPDDAIAAPAIEGAKAALAASVDRARAGTTTLSSAEDFGFEIASALKSLADRDLLRPALAFLAEASGAAVTAELAIVAKPETLQAYVDASGLRKPIAPPSPEALGWILDRGTCAWLAARAADEQHPIEPELLALLLAHTGELARFPDLVQECVQASDSLATFRERVVGENRIFLEDAESSARLRAFEWLRDRGAAPDGFDPLAPLHDRRAALDRAREKEAPAGDGR